MEPIKVWRFEDAPEEYRKLSTNGGDEDWLALIPHAQANDYISWTESGGFDACQDPSTYYHADGIIKIGAHA